MKELNVMELKEVDGGKFNWLGGLSGIFLGGLIYEAVTEGPEKCWNDFKEGFNSTYSY